MSKPCRDTLHAVRGKEFHFRRELTLMVKGRLTKAEIHHIAQRAADIFGEIDDAGMPSEPPKTVRMRD